MNAPKLYTYFLPTKKPLGPGDAISPGTKIKFIENHFLKDVKIVGFSCFINRFLVKTPSGSDIIDNRSFNITLVKNNNEILLDNIPSAIFRQDKTAPGVYKQGGQIKKFKPFFLNFEKSYLTTVSTIYNNVEIGFNFWYYEI